MKEPSPGFLAMQKYAVLRSNSCIVRMNLWSKHNESRDQIDVSIMVHCRCVYCIDIDIDIYIYIQSYTIHPTKHRFHEPLFLSMLIIHVYVHRYDVWVCVCVCVDACGCVGYMYITTLIYWTPRSVGQQYIGWQPHRPHSHAQVSGANPTHL